MNRCFICNKKISKFYLVLRKCKCDKIFCKNHIYNHLCSYNYYEEQEKYLKKSLSKIKTEKINKI